MNPNGIPISSLYLDDDLPEEDYESIEPEYWTPTCDSPAQSLESGANPVEYSTRGPRDVVVSGPVAGGWGPGRYYRSRRVALKHLREKYGADRVATTRPTAGRWSFLIKNLRAHA